MRIFILEDDLNRLGYLEHLFHGHEITEAKSVTQAARYQPPYDLVLLDHDLGGRQLTAHEDDGEAFVIAVKEQILSQQPAPVVIIHSFNPDGAQRMQGVLGGGALIAPFKSGAFNRVLTTLLMQKRLV